MASASLQKDDPIHARLAMNQALLELTAFLDFLARTDVIAFIRT
jgi:hypothetical protein